MKIARFAACIVFSLLAWALIFGSAWKAEAAADDANAHLSSIFQGAGQLSPSFSPSVTEYWVRMKSSEPGYFSSAIPSNPLAKIEYSMNGGNWNPINENTSTGHLGTNRGNNTFQFKVTSVDGTAYKIYTIYVYYPNTNDADLHELSSSDIVLNPAFTSSVDYYTASVPYEKSDITLTAVPSDPAATVSINGQEFNGKGIRTIPLITGTNTITISTASQDKSSAKTYTLTVVRAAASQNADLSALTVQGNSLKPIFQSIVSDYTLTDVGYATTELIVTPTVADSKANVEIRINGGIYAPVPNGSSSNPLALDVGSNFIEVKVTAQSGSTKTYTISIDRKSNNAPVEQLRQRLADLDTDHDGIHLNEVMAYLKSAHGLNDLNGDGTFDHLDLEIVLSEVQPKFAGRLD